MYRHATEPGFHPGTSQSLRHWLRPQYRQYPEPFPSPLSSAADARADSRHLFACNTVPQAGVNLPGAFLFLYLFPRFLPCRRILQLIVPPPAAVRIAMEHQDRRGGLVDLLRQNQLGMKYWDTTVLTTAAPLFTLSSLKQMPTGYGNSSYSRPIYPGSHSFSASDNHLPAHRASA